MFIGCLYDVPAGSAVVDWMVFMQLALTRVEAVTLASTLQEEGFLRTVGLKSVEALRTASLSEQFMDDSTALYSFVCCIDFESIFPSVLHVAPFRISSFASFTSLSVLSLTI